MAKQGSIKHYRQTGSAKVPASLPYGEIAIAKDGTIFAGNEQNSPVQAAPAIALHCTGQANETVTATLDDKQVTGTLDANGEATLKLPRTGVWAVTFGNGITQYVEAYFYGDYFLQDKPYLYKPGDACEALTGGWQARAWGGGYYDAARWGAQAPGLTMASDSMYISWPTSIQFRSGTVDIKQDVDLTRYKTLRIKYSRQCVKSICNLYVTRRNGAQADSLEVARVNLAHWDSTSKNNIEASLDISNITGAYDIAIGMFNSVDTTGASQGYVHTTVHEIWLEG